MAHGLSHALCRFAVDGMLATVSSFLCNTLAGRWVRHPDDSGTPGTQRCENDDGLYACAQPWTHQCSEPDGWIVSA